MDLESKLTELKYDYVRLQNDLDKRESLNQNIDPLLNQLEEIEKESQVASDKLDHTNTSSYSNLNIQWLFL